MKPTIPEVLPLIKKFANIKGNEVGGNLHITLDDGNVDDCHVQFCLEEAKKDNDILGIEVAETLLKMSKTQRLKLADIFYSLQDY
jgi:hypothetical protein